MEHSKQNSLVTNNRNLVHKIKHPVRSASFYPLARSRNNLFGLRLTQHTFEMNMKIYLLALLVFVVIDATMARRGGGGSKCKGKKKALCAQLSACKAEKDEQVTEIDELKAENAGQATEIDELNAENAGQATEIDELKAENAGQATEIEDLNAKIKELENKCKVKCYKSCKEAYDDGHRENKAYSLCLDSGEHQVYCHMSVINGCGSGGFTLVMKMDGAQSTFLYNSALWTNKQAHNVGAGVSGFDNQETKLSTYWESPFSKVCLGMKVGNDLRFISINQNAPSLSSLIADGQYRATSIGRNAWKSLLSDGSLQRNCNKEGFNAFANKDGPVARIGILSNEQNDCSSCDSRIGFGTGGNPDKTNSCGNVAFWFPDNGDKRTKAHGYILVQ